MQNAPYLEFCVKGYANMCIRSVSCYMKNGLLGLGLLGHHRFTICILVVYMCHLPKDLKTIVSAGAKVNLRRHVRGSHHIFSGVFYYIDVKFGF